MINLFDAVYFLALVFGSPVLLGKTKLRRSILGRGGKVEPRTSGRPAILFHAVSVGEAKLLKPLVEKTAEALPGWEIVVSATTPTGMEVAKKTLPNVPVVRFPLDFSWRVNRFLDRVRPDAIVLVELEVWPNFLKSAYKRGIPVIVANGRITRKSAQNYKRISLITRRIFGRLERVAAQNESYAARFQAVGVPDERITVTGNVKHDGLSPGEKPELAAAVRSELKVRADERVLVLGSTREGEENIFVEMLPEICDKNQSVVTVIAPRHLERVPEIRRLLEQRGMEYALKTALDKGAARRGNVIILDTMGELARIYHAADAVFVGGSLVPLGGQNMLEPAAAGKPVVFGPHTDNFCEEAGILLDAEGAIEASDPAAARDALKRILFDKNEAKRLGANAVSAIAKLGGAAARHAEIIRAAAMKKIAGAPKNADN
jgi:3-deoxy-D-manno-octulosonic-acid transferase